MNRSERKEYYESNKDKFVSVSTEYAINSNKDVEECIEIFKNLFINEEPISDEEKIRNIEIKDLLSLIRNKDKEVFLFAYFDKNYNLVNVKEIEGEKTQIDLSTGFNLYNYIFLIQDAQLLNQYLYVCHNHPCRYKADFSDMDYKFIEELIRDCQALNAKLIDVGVVTEWDYCSLAKRIGKENLL